MLSHDALDDLYDFTAFGWAMVDRTITSGMPSDDYARPAPGSGWPALADCVAHVLDSYDYLLNRVLQRGEYDPARSKSCRTWGQAQALRVELRQQFRDILDESLEGALHEPFVHTEEGFPPETLTIADVLANLVLHERAHHGDISTLFSQLGAQPPMTDYRVYVFAKSHRDMFPSW